MHRIIGTVMGRRRTPVITVADTGQKFVGEFYRDVGHPKPKHKLGRPRTETQRDLFAYLLRRQGVAWEEIAKRCGFDSFDLTSVELLQRAVKRLKCRIVFETPLYNTRLHFGSQFGIALHGD